MRILEVVAGLLSGGLLVLGLVLAVLVVLAPRLVDGTGLAAATGPRLDRVLVPIAVGLAGELLRWGRVNRSRAVRLVVGSLTVVAVLAALWWGWWR